MRDHFLSLVNSKAGLMIFIREDGFPMLFDMSRKRKGILI